MVKDEGNSGRDLFKEIEKKSWIFIIVCVTITTILGKINFSGGVLLGAVMFLYNFKFLYLDVERLLDITSSDGRLKRTSFSYASRLLIVSILIYLALVIFKVSVWGLLTGMILVTYVIIYSSARWFYKGGTLDNE